MYKKPSETAKIPNQKLLKTHQKKNSQKTLKTFPFENKLILRHESAISRTTDFSSNTPIHYYSVVL
jgi:hypothetical protein